MSGSGNEFIDDLVGGQFAAPAPGSSARTNSNDEREGGEEGQLRPEPRVLRRSFGWHNAVFRTLKSALNTKDLCAKRPREAMEEAIAEACEAWTQLDEKYFTRAASGGKKKGMPSGSSHLAIPMGMDLMHGDRNNIRSLSHIKIGPHSQEEYFSKLLDIFEDLPRYSSLLGADNEEEKDQEAGVPWEAAEAAQDGVPYPRMVPHDDLRAMRYLRGKVRRTSSQDFNTFDISMPIAPFGISGSCGNNSAPSPELLSDLVFEIDIYSSQVHAKKHKGRQSQIIMLGSQSLEQLHDSIYCNNCRASFESFIYIGEKFFVPSHALVGRTSSTLKLIDDIQQWISNDASTSQPAEAHRVATLDSITMSELKIETGKKYLYCHGGSCEHIVVISDIRTYSPRLDPHHITDFPAQKNVAFRKRRKCGVCKAMFARLIVFGDRLTDSNPFFFCDQCYYMLHYDASGQLQYSDYQVYQYSHDML